MSIQSHAYSETLIYAGVYGSNDQPPNFRNLTSAMEFNVMHHLMYSVSGTRLVVVIPPDKQDMKNQMPAIIKGNSTLTSWLL
jgi:hypothetical protein